MKHAGAVYKSAKAFSIFILLLCIAIEGAFFNRTATAVENGHPVVIALGDSYSSGEGTEPFYDQSSRSKFDSEDWLAHRSTKAWPGLLGVNGTVLNTMKDQNRGWYFAASSGAKTNHILGTAVDDDVNGQQTKEWSRWNGPVTQESGKKTLPCQADVLRAHMGTIDYVTLTMGGNDLGFKKIVETAVTDFDFIHHGGLKQKLREAIDLFEENNGVKSTLLNMYDFIHDTAGSQSKVIVAGYPHLFPHGGINLVSSERAQLINAAVDTFDTEMRSAVASSGKSYVRFVDVRSEFAGHECEYMNDIYLFAQEQDIKRDFISAYSVHPNAQGHEAYARAVQEVLDDLEREASTDPPSENAIQDVGIPSDVSISLVFDVSGSMEDRSTYSGLTKLENAQQQAVGFVNGSVRGEGGADGLSARIGVCSFTTISQVECGLSNDSAQIVSAIQGLRPLERTNMYAGLDEGIRQLSGHDGTKILMFLSDGLSNEGPSDAEILQLAQEAASQGITIYTIGYGSSHDIDESLLIQIADITGGSYSHEDPINMSAASVGLFATMMEARLRETQQVLLSQQGAVQQGATTQVGTYDVNSYGTMTCYLYWPGSVLDMQITDPDGVKVEDGYSGYSIDDSAIPIVVTIEGAKQGTWEMSVFGREVSMENEPFYVVAAHHETQAPVTTSGGGAATNNSGALLILVMVGLMVGIGAVYATTVRNRSS